jgi:hypothetical protein
MTAGGAVSAGGAVTGARRDRTAGAPRTAGARWWVAFAAAALAGVWSSVAVASGRPILAAHWSLLAELAVWAVAWAVGVLVALRLPGRWALAAILAAGILLRIAALTGPPTTSDDLYRYSWDGRVQAAGIDPYAQPPDSPKLANLREPWLWPDISRCVALRRPIGCTRINRPGQRTIYPPVAEAWFAAVYRLAGIGSRHKAWQAAGFATELGVLALLPLAQRRAGRDPRWTALYALSPAPALELVNNGHVDGLGILLSLAAVVVAIGPPAKRRDIGFGLLIGAAILVKLYPAILLLALVGARPGRRLPPLVRAGTAAAALVGLAYLPHVLAVGPKVLGYLPGYLKEEHYEGGGRFLVAAALHVPAHLGAAVSVAAVAAVAAWVFVRRPPVAVAGAALLGVLFLATSPVQPWYATSVLALATAAARPRWALLTLAGYPYFFAVILADRHAVGIGELCYGAAAAGIIAISWGQHRRGAREQSAAAVRPETPTPVPAAAYR